MKKRKSSEPSRAMVKPEGESICRSSSSSVVSSNEYLMVNILSRLPVKALSRFKCVSKQWNTLISDPYFVKTHQVRATQDPNIMKLLWVTHGGLIRVCSIEEKAKRNVTIDSIRPNYPNGFLRKWKFINMVGRPCNGLICIEYLCHEDTRLILVCNPATRDTVVIPNGKERVDNNLEGLGFCSSSNEFKLVRFYIIPEGFGFELFTIGQRETRGTHSLQPSRSWRHVGDLPYKICDLEGRFMCHVNGKVHWIIFPLSDSSSEYILTLDLELEEYDHEMNLMDLGGELCLALPILDGSVWLELWVLKDYANSIWCKEYQINVNIPGYPLYDDLKIVGKWGRRLLLMINNMTLCFYDPRNNSLELIIEKYLGSSLSYRVAPYVENLVLPF
ncbi:hypothetical protein NE237_005660 [Protea cynaroides]|uniref:F-box domain-containing protein n=1 Tax=Protea cynaroides TaxID=273540 RepID=A0A9Q0KLM4_9MAGN|nr:hypothetical protein NE237_005660 [Protea cynaroides]